MKRNRLKITMESRIHGDVYVRFGGERLETYRPKGRQGALRLACGRLRQYLRNSRTGTVENIFAVPACLVRFSGS